jgi:hypothetical protein
MSESIFNLKRLLCSDKLRFQRYPHKRATWITFCGWHHIKYGRFLPTALIKWEELLSRQMAGWSVCRAEWRQTRKKLAIASERESGQRKFATVEKTLPAATPSPSFSNPSKKTRVRHSFIWMGAISWRSVSPHSASRRRKTAFNVFAPRCMTFVSGVLTKPWSL